MRGHVVTLALFLVGCGGDTVAPITYEDVSGSFAGQFAGLTQGVAISAEFSLTVIQTEGQLTGAFSIVGTLKKDGVLQATIQDTGTLTGTVSAGTNPSINVFISPASCPNNAATLSGAYDSANGLLTISGPVPAIDENCEFLLVYQVTLLLSR